MFIVLWRFKYCSQLSHAMYYNCISYVFLTSIFLLHSYLFFPQLKLAFFFVLLACFSIYQSHIYTQTFLLSTTSLLLSLEKQIQESNFSLGWFSTSCSVFTPNLCSLSEVCATASNIWTFFLGFLKVKRITSFHFASCRWLEFTFLCSAEVYLFSIFGLPKFSSYLPPSLLLLVYHFTFVLMKLLEGVEIKCVLVCKV